MAFDLAVIALVSVLALALHVVLFLLVRRWMDRDLALSLAGNDPEKKVFMLQRLALARAHKVKRRDLQTVLQAAANDYKLKAPIAREPSQSPHVDS